MARPVVSVTAYDDNAVLDRSFQTAGIDGLCGFTFAAWRTDLQARSAFDGFSSGMDRALVDL